MMYLHIWPPEPSVPTWSWHSARTSEALEMYGPATERRTVTDISDEVQRRRRQVVAAVWHLIIFFSPARRPLGAATLNEAEEEDCCSNTDPQTDNTGWGGWGTQALQSWHSRVWHCYTQVVKETCYGNSRRTPCWWEPHVSRWQPIREASGSERKPRLSLFFLH